MLTAIGFGLGFGFLLAVEAMDGVDEIPVANEAAMDDCKNVRRFKLTDCSLEGIQPLTFDLIECL